MLKILRRGIRKLIVVTKKLSWQFFFVKFQWYFAKFLFNYYTLYLATKSLYPGSNEISFAQNLQFFFFFFNRTLVTTERKEKKQKKTGKRKKQSSPRLRFNGHIPNSPDSLSPPTISSARRHLENRPTPFSSLGPRTSTPPPSLLKRATFPWSMRLLLLFSFLRRGRDSLSPLRLSPLSRAKGGHAPLCSPLLLYVSSGAALFDPPPSRVRTRRTVPRKPGHGPRGCTVNAWNWNYRAISTAGWYIFARVREEVVARLGNLHFPIDCRDFLLPLHSLSRVIPRPRIRSFDEDVVRHPLDLVESGWISVYYCFLILFSVDSLRKDNRDNEVSSGLWHFFHVNRLVGWHSNFDDILDRIKFSCILAWSCDWIYFRIPIVEKYF